MQSFQVTSLRNIISSPVLDGAQIPDGSKTNFGNFHRWTPGCVVRPERPEDVAAVIRFAAENNISVSTRGSAHSESELAINDGGILLDMKSMNDILEVDEDNMTVNVQTGILWADLVRGVWKHKLIPRVLTNNLGVTVGGTLSIAGIGVASFRYGAQGDNVVDLDVVTGTGELLTCSREENSEIFWATLSGMGQFGVITRARIKLRQPASMVRTYRLLYDDLRKFMDDAQTAMSSDKWDHLESWCAPCVQGLKTFDNVRRPFARWFFPFHMSVEFEPDNPPDKDGMLDGLDYYDHVDTDDLRIEDFLFRLVPLFDLWKRLGSWENVHPWMESILPYDTAYDYINQVLAELPPAVAVGGHVLLWPSRGDVSELKLFMRPQTKFVVGFGILPSVPHKFFDMFRENLSNASDLSMMLGGKRYVSGFLEFDKERWKNHWGDSWADINDLKRKYDPAKILNPGFIPFD